MKGLSILFSQVTEKTMLPCLNKQIFGVECPGCGLQRSVLLLFDGNFKEAFFMYPAIYPMIFLLLFLLADQIIKIKYANVISISLMITTVTLILTNFLFKLI